MAFTDEDLKELKHSLDDPTEWQDAKEMKALIARLEAAEKVIEAHCRLEQEKVSYDNFVSLLNAWRKAAGK